MHRVPGTVRLPIKQRIQTRRLLEPKTLSFRNRHDQRQIVASNQNVDVAGKRPQVRILSFAPLFKDLGALDPAAGGGKRSLNGSKTEVRKQGQRHRPAVANRILQCGSVFAVTTADRPEVPNA